jgi:hypothetical protein
VDFLQVVMNERGKGFAMLDDRPWNDANAVRLIANGDDHFIGIWCEHEGDLLPEQDANSLPGFIKDPFRWALGYESPRSVNSRKLQRG